MILGMHVVFPHGDPFHFCLAVKWLLYKPGSLGELQTLKSGVSFLGYLV